jgi:hypothetical protein
MFLHNRDHLIVIHAFNYVLFSAHEHEKQKERERERKKEVETDRER